MSEPPRMCIACEMSFWDMIDALAPEDRERILRAGSRPLCLRRAGCGIAGRRRCRAKSHG